MTLRPYREGDALPMFLLDRKCFEQRFRFSLHAMRDFAEADGALTVIAEVEGTMAGFAIAEVSVDAAYLTTVDVDPAWRRKGIALSMLRWIEEAEPAIRWVLLHVYTENASAIGFYGRAGFEVQGLVPDFYGAGADASLYRRAVSRS